MKSFPVTLMCALALLSVGLIQAATKSVTLTAVKDCTVVKAMPNTAFPSDPNLSAYKTNAAQQQFFLWEFVLPSDCIAQNIDAQTFKFKMVMLKQYLTTNRQCYLYIIKDASDLGVDDLNALTFNTAPGVLKDLVTPTTTGNIDAAAASYVGYSLVTQTDGQPWDYVPALDANINYVNSLITNLNADTNQRLIFLYHPRYLHPQGDYWASTENGSYDGPQIEFNYEPVKAAIEKSGDFLTAVEGGASVTYNIYLTSQPASDVTVSLVYDDTRLVPSVAEVVFTPANYAVPQTITVAALDDSIALADDKIMISHTVASADVDFDGSATGNVYVKVIDNDSATVSLTAVKDSTVKRLAASSSFAAGDITLKKFNNSPDVDLQVGYVQFDLPQDFLYAVDAKLTLVQKSAPSSDNVSKVYLIGVNDDIEQADADVFTWYNAAALDKRAQALEGINGYDDEAAVYLGDIDLATSGAAGVEISTLPASSGALSNWLSNDTDKKVTIMLVRQKEGDVTDTFAAVGDATYSAAVLDITYGTTAQNYCGRPGHIFDDQDFNNDCIVNFDDFASFAQDWIEQ